MFDFHQSTNNDSVLRITVWLLLPVICLYALYIQVHGEISPGGGFQAGVILSVAYILFLFVFGLYNAENFIPSNLLSKLAGVGVMIYIVVGFSTIFLGGKFLDYNRFSFFSSAPQELGLFVVELGIGICIFGSMCSIIFTFYSLLSDNERRDLTDDIGKY